MVMVASFFFESGMRGGVPRLAARVGGRAKTLPIPGASGRGGFAGDFRAAGLASIQLVDGVPDFLQGPPGLCHPIREGRLGKTDVASSTVVTLETTE